MKETKYIVAYDTICDGWQCALDEDGKPSPTLFDSESDAIFEMFDDALAMMINQTEEELAENNIALSKVKEMVEIKLRDDTDEMREFLDQNPECNYNDEFIVPAEEFVFGRKAIFNGEGVVIKGKKL